MFQGPTESPLIGYSIESIWTLFKLAPFGNGQVFAFTAPDLRVLVFLMR